MSVACTSINDEPLSTSLVDNEREANVFNNIPNKHDGLSFHQIPDETHAVMLAVLENWIDVTTGVLQCQQPRIRAKRALLIHIEMRTS